MGSLDVGAEEMDFFPFLLRCLVVSIVFFCVFDEGSIIVETSRLTR